MNEYAIRLFESLANNIGALRRGADELEADLKALRDLFAADGLEGATFAPLSQRDPLWANVTLGFSTHGQTIGGYGCAITCIAMWLNYVLRRADYTPLIVNTDLKTHNGYVWDFAHTDQNLVSWPALPNIYPLIFNGKVDCPNTPAPLSLIDTMLTHGWPAIVYVDASLTQVGLQQHFVMITGKADENYSIANPWTGQMESLTPQYGRTPAQAVCGIVQLEPVT